MKILELGKFYAPHRGGMETLLESFCEGFARRGARVECVVANDDWRSAREERNGVLLWRVGSWGQAASVSLAPGYTGRARRAAADVWHHHFPNPLADLACLRGGGSVPLLVTYHSDVVRQTIGLRFYGPIIRSVLRRATWIVVASPQLAERSIWLKPFAEKRWVIPFGIRLDQFQWTEAERRQIEQLRRRASGRLILLSVGRLVEYKGHRHLLEAARRLPAAVWLVGAGPLEKALRQQSLELGLGERVTFWGEVPQERLKLLLGAADIFVFPSVTPNEAFGLAQVEAMACGKPVVSCQLESGVAFVNRHEETGLLVPPRDSAALESALNRLADQPEWRRSLGEAARRRAHKEFAEETMLERYWELLERRAPTSRAGAGRRERG